METREHAMSRRKSLHVGAIAFLAVLSACNQARTEATPPTSSNNVAAGLPEHLGSLRTAEQIQRRYEQIADADEAYIHCMEGYVPNYRHEVEVNGGVFGADPLDNTPHPSLEGCRSQREYRNELAGEVGLPPI